GSKQVMNGWMLKSWAYDSLDQRLASTEVLVENGGGYQQAARHDLTYDAEGTVTEHAGTLNGAQRRECYDHDRRGRLIEAYTVTRSATCAEGTRGTGDQPYSHSYRYSPAGRLLERVEQGVRTGYAYPASGGTRPHAPTTVGSDAYQWDDNGKLVSRSGTGQTETFSWDVQGFLTSVSGPGGSTSFVYDPSGLRLLRRTSTGNTLYLAGHEVSASSDGTTVTAVRSYSFDGELVATRSPDGVDFVAGDPSGSVELAVPDGGTPTATRAYNPYGGVRARSGDTATDRGFLGQIEDSTTKLSYLNARYYDATTGIFLSTDPLYDTSKPSSLNPYGYGAGDPVSFSDAGGLTPSYSYGLEQQNAALRYQNQQLTGYVTQLLGNIDTLQGIIREQDRRVNELLTDISALEAFIRQQDTIIRHLTARVAQLQRQVAYWKGRAHYWYGRAMHWRSQAYHWQGRYNYLRYQVVEPTFRRIYGSGADAQLAAVDAMSWTAASLPCFCTRDRPNPLRNHFNEDPPSAPEPSRTPPVRWTPDGYIMGPPPGPLDNQFNVNTIPTGLGVRYERVPPNTWRLEPNRTLIDGETACTLAGAGGATRTAKNLVTRGKGSPWVTGGMLAVYVACKATGN
ncbi:MAG TPA: RHS repeat-associated core domain-containing protein, partial [Nonomuraea sp.]|nr:RHS repeat-associated core domain-containing protein [Nonomuraea sp.]